VLFIERHASEERNGNSAQNEDHHEAPDDEGLTATPLHVGIGGNEADQGADHRPEADPQPILDVKRVVQDEDQTGCESRVTDQVQASSRGHFRRHSHGQQNGVVDRATTETESTSYPSSNEAKSSYDTQGFSLQ